MADKTKIEWSDATANVINGCSLESPGCTNCYAMKQAHRFPVRQGLTQHSNGGMVWTGEVRFHEPALLKVLSWKRPRMIFWNAHGDMFHPDVPDEWIDRCFATMALTPQHIHQVLTKRSDRMREYFSGGAWGWRVMEAKKGLDPNHKPGMGGILETTNGALPNVWLGVSVEDQPRADQRIPDLLATPAAVRWLSCEPLLGPVDLNRIREDIEGGSAWESCLTGKRFDWLDGGADIEGFPRIDWIVAGGESGPGARGSTDEVEANMRSLRDQCAAAGVAFFAKQNFKKLPLPDDLMVKEWPHA